MFIFRTPESVLKRVVSIVILLFVLFLTVRVYGQFQYAKCMLTGFESKFDMLWKIKNTSSMISTDKKFKVNLVPSIFRE